MITFYNWKICGQRKIIITNNNLSHKLLVEIIGITSFSFSFSTLYFYKYKLLQYKFTIFKNIFMSKLMLVFVLILLQLINAILSFPRIFTVYLAAFRLANFKQCLWMKIGSVDGLAIVFPRKHLPLSSSVLGGEKLSVDTPSRGRARSIRPSVLNR